MNEKKLFLLDGFALIYRAFFAFSQNPRITTGGFNTSAIFGFTNTLLEVVQKQKPTHIAVVFDTAAKTERHEMFEDYKAHRQEMPEDLSKAIPYIFKVVEAFNIPVIKMDGYEADDLIGTLAKMAEKEGFTTYMMTPDKDFGQLVSENIFMYKPARLGNAIEVLGVEEIKKKWEIRDVLQVIDILGLWGDASDNIPGVPGVGEKTAKKLIRQYHSMEGIYENIEQLTGKIKENFINFKEQAFLSKKLATINLECPITFDEKSLELEPVNREAVLELFTELEFKTLTTRVLGSTHGSPEVAKETQTQGDLFNYSTPEKNTEETIEEEEAEPTIFKTILDTPHNYKLVETAEDRRELINLLLSQKEFCFDTETTGLDYLNEQILGMEFSCKSGEGYYVPTLENGAEIIAEFKPVFECGAMKIAQNLKYDMQLLLNYNIEVQPPFFDTMLAHYLVEPDKRHGMDFLAETFLQYSPVSITDLIGKKGKDQLTMADVELEKVKEYAAEDADITLQLKEKIAPLVINQNATKVFEELELPLVPVLAYMEREGVRIDPAFLNEYSKKLAVEIVEAEDNIYKESGIKFNIASPKQLGEVLFEKLGLDDKAKKTKTGQYQTGEDVLAKLAHKSPIVAHILDFRELQKLKSTYVDTLPLLINPKTGRLHTTYQQALAATGRLSSINPNLQNIPVRSDKGKEVRKAFIPRDENHLLISADYSQIELRIVASISGDEGMIAAFNNKIDIHTATAAKVFGVDVSEVTKEMRYKAKSVNFGIIYGQGAFGLAENLSISRSEAKEIIDNYWEQFPGIKTYMKTTVENAKKYQYVETLLGRRRYLRDINSANATVRNFAERVAINAPIQGTAADMIKIAMINIHAELNKRKLATRMILQVHDELIFDAPKTEAEEVSHIIKKLMIEALPLKVPIEAEAGMGENWLVAH
ncbi:MAG: DNA polymerase I [Bacteroidetes bacterium]|nr:DNA polymerase I [Bacteroidota bacterium]